MAAQDEKALRLTLLENGLDFIREGVESVYGRCDRSERAYKYALLHMFAGVLLVIKERLKREHPALIFSKVEEVGKPGATTVGFTSALARLQRVAGISLGEADLKLLRAVQKRRNELEHYAVDISTAHADALVGQLVDFIDRFLHDHLNESLGAHISRDAWDDVSMLASIAARQREAEAERWRLVATPFFDLGDDELAELADLDPYHPKHNPDPVEMMECSECGGHTVVPVHHEVAVCTNTECREVFPLEECPRCGCQGIDVAGFCSSCCDYIRDQ